MSLKRVFFSFGVFTILSVSLMVLPVLAGEPAPDPDTYKIVGPTMWAVGVVDCSTSTPFYTLRVKKIEGCNVETAPLSATGTLGGVTACPTSPQQVLNYQLPPGSLFGYDCTPIVTKVKNWEPQTDIVSFDAQINFLVLKEGGPEECTAP